MLRDNSRRIRGLMPDFVKIGYLGQSPLLPAVGIVPSTMQIADRKSNRETLIGREFAFQIYDEGITRGEAEAKVRDHTEALMRMLRNDSEYFFKDKSGRKQAYSFDWGVAAISRESNTLRSGAFVKEAILPITIYSKYWRPQRGNVKKHYLRMTDEEAIGKVFNKVQRNRQSRLRVLQNFEKGGTAPRPQGVSAGFSIISEASDRYAAGLDLNFIRLQFTIWSKMLSDERSLLENCKAVDILFELFEEDESFDGAFYNSEFEGANWGERVTKRTEPPYYETIITLSCQKPQGTLEGTN